MIKITKEQLIEGLDLIRKCSMCPKTVSCFWGKWEDVLNETCLIEACSIVEFRKTLEVESPLFYGKLLRLSEYSRIIQNVDYLESETEVFYFFQAEEDIMEFHDLEIFTQAVCLVLYPLFLANNEKIPPLTLKEIKKEQRRFSKREFDAVGQIMGHINKEWLDWIRFSVLGGLINPRKYMTAIALMVELFLQGAQSSQFSSSPKMFPSGKEAFFEEIKSYLGNEKKGSS